MTFDALVSQAERHGFAMVISTGRMNRRDLLDLLPRRVGKGAALDLVSWTIGEADCKWLERARNEGRIGHLRIIADVSTRSKTPERYAPLARLGQVIDIGDVHAKASIVESADGSRFYAEVTSANLNRNRRAESWALTTDPRCVADLRSSIAGLSVATFEPVATEVQEPEVLDGAMLSILAKMGAR